MGSRFALAVLCLFAAGAILALVAIAWFYASLVPHSAGLPEGGCGFLFVSAMLFLGFLGGAAWLFLQGED